MERSERKCNLYLDLESARGPLESAGAPVTLFIDRLMAFARSHGRVLAALAYGDIDGDESRDLKRAGCEARLTSEDGEGSAPESIAIALDAMEAMCRGPFVESTILVTDDAQLGEVVRRFRRQGRYVVVVAPGMLIEQEPARSADRSVTIEMILSGDVEAEALPSVAPPSPGPARPRAPSGQTIDFPTYDWTRLILLMRDLEAKMPFVGMRWLKNKVIGPHNVSAVTIADKQLLLNKAVEEGLMETYRVGNRDESGDPVTACRLVRTSERVIHVLDTHPVAPSVAAMPAASLGETG